MKPSARPLRIGFIGTGQRNKTQGVTGYAMAYAHADAYRAAPNTDLVACADIKRENGIGFAEATRTRWVYTDHREMLRKEKLDMISICTWPALHAPMILDCVRAGVKAVHCEKPMAMTLGEAAALTAAAAKRRCRVTFNHQRRFGKPYRAMRDLAWSGKLGTITRMEAMCPNLYDWGTHWVDMLQMFNKEVPAEWVIGQGDYRSGNRWFGAPQDNQGIWQVKYTNGVMGLFILGPNWDSCALRLIGTKGIAELHWQEPIVRIWRQGRRAWDRVKVDNELHGGPTIQRAIASAIRALRTGGRSELCAENALKGAQIIFGGYQSSRIRGRVDLPLTIKDNPLETMIQRHEIAFGWDRPKVKR